MLLAPKVICHSSEHMVEVKKESPALNHHALTNTLN